MKIISYNIWKSFKQYPVITEGYINGTKFKVHKHNNYTYDSEKQYKKRKNNMITISIFNYFTFTIQFRDRKLPEYCTEKPFSKIFI